MLQSVFCSLHRVLDWSTDAATLCDLTTHSVRSTKYTYLLLDFQSGLNNEHYYKYHCNGAGTVTVTKSGEGMKVFASSWTIWRSVVSNAITAAQVVRSDVWTLTRARRKPVEAKLNDGFCRGPGVPRFYIFTILVFSGTRVYYE